MMPFTDGDKKQNKNKPHVNVKSDVLRRDCGGGRWLCAATRTVGVFDAFFSRQFFVCLFVLY